LSSGHSLSSPFRVSAAHQDLLTRTSEGTDISGQETLWQRRDGSRFPVNISAAPMRDENGQCIGVLSVIEDISEGKRMELDLMSGCAEGLPETQLPRGAAFPQKPFSFASCCRFFAPSNPPTEPPPFQASERIDLPPSPVK
jgi:hypothetical protein